MLKGKKMARLDGRACGSADRGAQLPLLPFQARWLGHLAPPAYGGAAYRVVHLPRQRRSWQCNKCGGSNRLVWGVYWEGHAASPCESGATHLGVEICERLLTSAGAVGR